MATGRTLADFQRIYMDGYNLSCYALDTGEQGVAFEEYEATTLCSPIKGVLVGKPTVSLGPVNGVFDSTAITGVHAIASAGQGSRHNVSVIYGIRAAPVNYDPCFSAPMILTKYAAVEAGMTNVRLDFGGEDAASGMLYTKHFGHMLHVMGSETGANSANTNVNNGAASAAGGWLMYHITSITGAGTVTISVDDSANGTSWSALSGATSGAIATASVPTSGIVQLAVTATVRQYLRFQVALAGSASACEFALSFIRG